MMREIISRGVNEGSNGRLDSKDQAKSKMYYRAVESAIWGMPIVSTYAMREAFFRDAGAKYGDIVYWSKPLDWKAQLPTPNATCYYVYFNINTKDGPIVVDLPEGKDAELSGTLLDAWQIPLVDVGHEGEDKGKGARYLVLPPIDHEMIPDGYIPVFTETYNGYALIRVVPAGKSEIDHMQAMELIKKIRLYHLSEADDLLVQRHIDITGKSFNGIVQFDDTYFDALAEMIHEEPVETRDLVAMAHLRTLGITKGKEFKPNAAIKEILKRAATEVRNSFIQRAVTGIEPFWEDAHWGQHQTSGPKTRFTFISDDGYYDVDGRGLVYFINCGMPKKKRTATCCLAAMTDASGIRLDGEKIYRLSIPASVPVRQHWDITVYDLETASFFKNAPVLAIDSYNPDLKKNVDGTIDVYFGTQAPDGKESNWIYTAAGKQWFTLFRFYGPERTLIDKIWRMEDIREV